MSIATSRSGNASLSGTASLARFSLGNRILLSFGAIFLLMLITAIISYTRVRAINDEADKLERQSVLGLFLSTSIRAASSESVTTLQRALFVDGDEAASRSDLERVADSLKRIDKLAAQYPQTVDGADDTARFDEFRAAYADALPKFNEVLRMAQGSRPDAQRALLAMNPAWDKVTRAANAMVEEDKSQADDWAHLIRQSAQETEITLAVALGIVLLVALVTGFALYRAVTVPMARVVDVLDVMRTGNLAQRLALRRHDEFGTLENGFNRMAEELTSLVAQAQKSSLQVTTSVAEIAATSKEQQATAAETAATTTEIGATSREIVSTSRDLLLTMNEVSRVAEQSATLAGTSQNGLSRMEDTMRSVMEAAGSVNAKLAVLNEKAVNINQVVATITKVADQTNLLSLNAAIEAEKAGEYGRGFGVVATEIRRLADQTAVATYDIEQTVKEIQSAVSAGVMGMEKFSEEVRRGMHDVQQVGGQLSQIIQEVQALAPRFQAVNEGMHTQANGAEQITQALSQLSEAAQQTAESLRQSSQAIDDLTLVANQLRTGVSRFKIEA
ncbi:methyl-accepting chemotaxis protein [Paraburkholderia sp. SOS3]|jgi:methyl-accepting chemotaxis protein WspA|uniref:methyl-accepting chemotaxis protein n=1 Tax=Paraburkholderia sp. SOS3 TaxID=1926494 RepID=UPI0009477768|nr:methyl-accepting chemotaxis protein [Paraburkholderia sp. SOS3]APR35143.1 methyl-accepting chemotaxis protein [Paraburkholderia sp. SOS3]